VFEERCCGTAGVALRVSQREITNLAQMDEAMHCVAMFLL